MAVLRTGIFTVIRFPPDVQAACDCGYTAPSYVVVQGIARRLHGHVVRGPVLSAAPVRLSRRGERHRRARALRDHGTALVRDHEPGRSAYTRLWARDAVARAGVSRFCVAAHQAGAGCATGPLPCVVLPPDAGTRGGEGALATLVSMVQRGPGAAADRNRHSCGAQTRLRLTRIHNQTPCRHYHDPPAATAARPTPCARQGKRQISA